MLENISYRFKNRNSKKNLKLAIKKLNEDLVTLRHETIGQNRNGWITWGFEAPKYPSVNDRIDDILDYLGVDYTEKKLAPKPKEKKEN